MSGGRPAPYGVVLAAALTVAVAGLSRFPYRAEPPDRGVLRLSWRYTPPAGEDCRRPTSEELAELPAHMRNPNACLRDPRTYRLRLSVDETPVFDESLGTTGARRDRPVVVYREVPLSAGGHRIDVRFEESRAGGQRSGPALSWTRSVTVEPHEVIVIEYDNERGALERREPPDSRDPDRERPR